MSNWFEFKGINSQQYKELIVQELPPIITPAMRYEATYRDGSDGATINKQGYDMVVKAVSIGLNSLDNIDRIKAWLNGNGQITFSNEPHKYYVGEILDQIDYTRLGRFRTAPVAFLCQPYGYLKNEQAQEFSSEGTYTIYNNGTTVSKPLITIIASGDVEIWVGEVEICSAHMSGDVYNFQIDSEIQNCFKLYYGTYIPYNRIFEGDFPVLNPGANTIQIVGSTVTKVSVQVRSRFI